MFRKNTELRARQQKYAKQCLRDGRPLRVCHLHDGAVRLRRHESDHCVRMSVQRHRVGRLQILAVQSAWVDVERDVTVTVCLAYKIKISSKPARSRCWSCSAQSRGPGRRRINNDEQKAGVRIYPFSGHVN